MTAGTACNRCGATVESGARFCMSCGSEVVRPSAPTLATPASAADRGAADHYQQELIGELRRATLGEYEVLTLLGQGGMASVYLAHDIQLDRKVAIKVMSPALLSGPGMVDRFKLEARTAAKLSHPHIIPIFAVKEVGKLLFFVMKFVEGRPLDSIIEELQKLPLPMVMTILTKVGEALGYAHRNGVVHRDIKPANIMIDVEGLPVVTDFGIAKVSDQQGLTMTGATIGTPTYMSPEQCASGKITGASDQYSLGIVVYEMLTGTAPFRADSLMTIMHMHCHDEPPPITELRGDCPPALRDAILRMLAKDPPDRWESMEGLVAAVGGATTLAYDDPIRTQLVGLALAGESHKAIERISTPRSPMPLAAGGGTALAGRHAPTAVDRRGAARGASPSRSKAWIGVAGVLVAGAAITLGVWQPWASNTAGVVPVSEPATPVEAGPNNPLAPAVARIVVQPNQTTLRPNGTQRLTAQAFDSVGTQTDANVQWSSDNPSVASVSLDGDVTALAAGSATITAVAGVASSAASVTVLAPAPPVPPGGNRATVSAVRIAGLRDEVPVGTSFRLSATPVDAAGGTLSGRNVVWQSSNTTVAVVDGVGQVTAMAEGSANITATSEARSASVSLVVTPEAVAAVTLRPDRVDPLEVDQRVALTARATSAGGRPLTDRQEQWQSTNPAVATVQNGVVQARGAGQATIRVTIEGRSAQVDITVQAATPEPPPVVVDPEQAVRSAVGSYAQALQLRDFQALRQVFPTLPTDQENTLREFLGPLRDLTVQVNVQQLNVAGDVANVVAQQRYEFTDSGRNQVVEGALTLLLRRGSDGVWRITETR